MRKFEEKYPKLRLIHPTRSVEQAVELVRRSVLTEMDGRDLARCLALEHDNQTAAYCVSMEKGAIYDPRRHLTANFNRTNFVRDFLAYFPGVKFRQIILDYFWIPKGSWAISHWRRSFFTDTLPNFVTSECFEPDEVLKGDACLYLPFCLHCVKQVIAAEKILSKHYKISFLTKSELSEHDLWAATNTIEPNAMQNWLGKAIAQEDLYCTFAMSEAMESMDCEVSAHTLDNDFLCMTDYLHECIFVCLLCYCRYLFCNNLIIRIIISFHYSIVLSQFTDKETLSNILLRIKDFANVRMIKLTVLTGGQKGGFVGLGERVKIVKKRRRVSACVPSPQRNVKTKVFNSNSEFIKDVMSALRTVTKYGKDWKWNATNIHDFVRSADADAVKNSTSDDPSLPENNEQMSGNDKLWYITGIYSARHVIRSPTLCQSADCNLVACSEWIAEDGETCQCCLDCQVCSKSSHYATIYNCRCIGMPSTNDIYFTFFTA